MLQALQMRRETDAPATSIIVQCSSKLAMTSLRYTHGQYVLFHRKAPPRLGNGLILLIRVWRVGEPSAPEILCYEHQFLLKKRDGGHHNPVEAIGP